MKISYRSHSSIRLIESGDFFNALILPEDVDEIYRLKIPSAFRALAPNFRNIKIITTPFYKAMELSINKLLQSDLTDLEYSGMGTFIFRTDSGTTETYCYDFHIINGEVHRIVFFYFQNGVLYKYYNSGLEQEYIMSGIPKNHPGSTIQNQLNWLFEFYLFSKFATVEIRELKPNSRAKDISCKYINDTSSNIKILDSKWFTTLVKSDAFKVRGHFRLQPKKKDGEWTKELIWIHDFQKEGYTAPARKLKHDI